MWLTRLALRNPVLILMVSLMVLVLGFVSLQRLPVDLFPEISVPVIRVATFYRARAPADIERRSRSPSSARWPRPRASTASRALRSRASRW
jgi:HAE1 family hydrophobic/amphiphilic exporter-1